MMSNDRFETTLTVTIDGKTIVKGEEVLSVRRSPTNSLQTIAFEISRKLISSEKKPCESERGTATTSEMLALTTIHKEFRAELNKMVKMHEEYKKGDITWETLMDREDHRFVVEGFLRVEGKMGDIINGWWDIDSDSY